MGQHNLPALSAEEWSELIGTFDTSHVHRESWKQKVGIAGILEALLSSLRTYAEPVPMYDDALYVQLLSFLEQHSLLLLVHAGTEKFAAAFSTLELLAGKPRNLTPPSSGSPLQPLRRSKTAPRESHQLLMRGIAMTAATSILIELDAAVAAPGILQRFGCWLLDVVVHVNNSADRSLRSTACTCLRELEADSPGLLRHVTAQLHLSCERERTQAFQSYALLLADALLGIMQHEVPPPAASSKYPLVGSSGAGGRPDLPLRHAEEDSPPAPLLFSSSPTNSRDVGDPARTPPRPAGFVGGSGAGGTPSAPAPTPASAPRPFLLSSGQLLVTGDRDWPPYGSSSPWNGASQGGGLAGARAEDARTLRKCVNLLLEAAPKMNGWCRADLLLALSTLLRACAHSPARAPYLLELPAHGSLRHLLGLDATYDPLLCHTLARIQGREGDDVARAALVTGGAPTGPQQAGDVGGDCGGPRGTVGMAADEEDELASATRQVGQHIAALVADGEQESAHRLLALHWLMARGCQHQALAAHASAHGGHSSASSTLPLSALLPSVFDPLAVVTLKLEAAVAACSAPAASGTHLLEAGATDTKGGSVGRSRQGAPGKVTSVSGALGRDASIGGRGGGASLQQLLFFFEECGPLSRASEDGPSAVADARPTPWDSQPSEGMEGKWQELVSAGGGLPASLAASAGFFRQVADSRHIRAMRKRHAAATYGGNSLAPPPAPPAPTGFLSRGRHSPTSFWPCSPPGSSWVLWRTLLLALANATAAPDVSHGEPLALPGKRVGFDGQEGRGPARGVVIVHGGHPAAVLAAMHAAASCVGYHPSQVPHFLRLVTALRLLERAHADACTRTGAPRGGLTVSAALLVRVMALSRADSDPKEGTSGPRPTPLSPLHASASNTAHASPDGSVAAPACRPALTAAADLALIHREVSERDNGGQGACRDIMDTLPDAQRLRRRLTALPSLSSPCRALPLLLALLGGRAHHAVPPGGGRADETESLPFYPGWLCLDFLRDWLLAAFCACTAADHTAKSGLPPGASQTIVPPRGGVLADDVGGGGRGAWPAQLAPAGLWQEGSCLLLLVRLVLANLWSAPNQEGVRWCARRLLRLCECVFPNQDVQDAARRQRYLLEHAPVATACVLVGGASHVADTNSADDTFFAIASPGSAGPIDHAALTCGPTEGGPVSTAAAAASTSLGALINSDNDDLVDGVAAHEPSIGSPLLSLVCAPPGALALHFLLQRLSPPGMVFSLDHAMCHAVDGGEGDLHLLGVGDGFSKTVDPAGTASAADGAPARGWIAHHASLSNLRLAVRMMEDAATSQDMHLGQHVPALLRGQQLRSVEKYCAWLDSGGAASITIPCRLTFLPQQETCASSHPHSDVDALVGGNDDPWLVVEGVDSSPRPEPREVMDASFGGEEAATGLPSRWSLPLAAAYGVSLSFECRPREYCHPPPAIVIPVLRRAQAGGDPVAPCPGCTSKCDACRTVLAAVSTASPAVPASGGQSLVDVATRSRQQSEGDGADLTGAAPTAAGAQQVAFESVSVLLQVRSWVPLPCTLQACLSFSNRRGDSWHGQVARIPLHMEDVLLPLAMPEDILSYGADPSSLALEGAPSGHPTGGAHDQGSQVSQPVGEAAKSNALVFFDTLWHAFAVLPSIAATNKMLPDVTCQRIAAVAGDSRGLGRFIVAVSGRALVEAFLRAGFGWVTPQTLACPDRDQAVGASGRAWPGRNNVVVELGADEGGGAGEANCRSRMSADSFVGMVKMAILLPPNWHLLVCLDIGMSFSMAHICTDFLPALAFVDELLECFLF